MAAGDSAAGEPSGSPQIARTCCSNWEVAAPSIVQWPLLWTRGASSLTRSEPSASRNSSAVSVPHRSIASASRSPMAVARSATSALTGAGATDSTRIPASWRLRAIGNGAVCPWTSRASTIDSSHLERQLALDEQRRARRPAEPRPGVVQLRDVGDPELPAPVVAADRQLEPERQAELPGGRARRLRRADLAPRRDADARRFHEPALGEPVLGDGQRAVPGAHRQPGLDRRDDVRGDMLELVGHDRAPVGESQRRPDVVVRPDDDPIRDRRGRAVRIRVQHRDPVAHRPRREREHPPQLAAAQDADHRGRQDRRRRIHSPECRRRGTRLPSRSCAVSRAARSATSCWSG